ncbi:hypothetical protein SAMN02745229_02901 [Butyrivibrio fibrisolvens DSM 3071]|uniref:Uncharacterized protein n=1 Tax=Butyrivibrio fibrisolvens DSM 3071 TaxID=1121131 RepID=A0A1M6A745_BUTFI|nr:hypothetical protein [Butyrivibrio fibrisolvens]SHI32239.1 hypothetical protein SAMN02745229_02901 [Butyrivibrio fibrisolvens DSM 3071]
MEAKKKKIVSSIIAYAISAILFGFYVLMLVRSINPQTTDDYRMRYLEDGYFYGQQDE